MTNKEIPSQSPEVVSEKPKSILAKIEEALEPYKWTRDNSTAVYVEKPVAINRYEDAAKIFLSPRKTMLDIKNLNQFAKNLSILLNPNIPTAHLKSGGIGEHGGIVYPAIEWFSHREILGKTTTTTEYDLYDPLLREVEPKVKEIRRTTTKIVVCPSPQIAQLARFASTYQFEMLPRGINEEIAYGITDRQLALLRTVKTFTPKPIKNKFP